MYASQSRHALLASRPSDDWTTFSREPGLLTAPNNLSINRRGESGSHGVVGIELRGVECHLALGSHAPHAEHAKAEVGGEVAGDDVVRACVGSNDEVSWWACWCGP